VKDLGYRVKGLGYRVKGYGYRLKGLGSRVQYAGFVIIIGFKGRSSPGAPTRHAQFPSATPGVFILASLPEGVEVKFRF